MVKDPRHHRGGARCSMAVWPSSWLRVTSAVARSSEVRKSGHGKTGHSAETCEFPTKRANALSSYALTCVELRGRRTPTYASRAVLRASRQRRIAPAAEQGGAAWQGGCESVRAPKRRCQFRSRERLPRNFEARSRSSKGTCGTFARIRGPSECGAAPRREAGRGGAKDSKGNPL